MSRQHCTVALLATLVAAAAAMPSNVTTFDCTAEGRYPDPADCTAFFTCLPTDNGDFISKKGSCNNNAFDKEQQVCVPHDKIKGCTPRDSRQLTLDPDLQAVCAANSNTFACSDCRTLINCVGTKAYVDSICDVGYTCQENVAGFMNGATCYPKAAESNTCSCLNPSTFAIDPFNEKGFYFCPLTGSDPMVHECPNGMTFQLDALRCQSIDGIPPCSTVGVFAKPADCSMYYTCITTATGWAQESLSCPDGQMYNEATDECSDPCTWPSPTFACSAEGRYRDPSDCSQFIQCIANPEDATMFIQTVKKCPTETVWDPDADEGKGHCVLVPDQTTPCVPVRPTMCDLSPCSTAAAFRMETTAEGENTHDSYNNVIQLLHDAGY